jgi:hypothetical protein
VSRRCAPALRRETIAILVAVALSWPAAAGAQPAMADDAPPSADDSEPASEASAPTDTDQGELWRDAQAKLGTSDYAGAIASLTRLYELVVHDPEAAALRQRVQWALHDAHLGAYGLQQDRRHLDLAHDLVGKYLEALPDTDVERREGAQTELARIEGMIEAHREPEPDPVPAPVPEPVPEPDPEPAAEIPETTAPPPDPSARPLIIAGATLAGVGVVGTALLVGGLASANSAVGTFETEPAQRDDARAAIKRGNAIGIAGGVIAGAFTITGAVLLGLGLQRRRATIGPAALRGGPGLVWTGRF